jgi:hypothetical protein
MSWIGVLLLNHNLSFFLCFLTTISADFPPLLRLTRRQSCESAADTVRGLISDARYQISDIWYSPRYLVCRVAWRRETSSWRGPLGLALILLSPGITDRWSYISDTWALFLGLWSLICATWSQPNSAVISETSGCCHNSSSPNDEDRCGGNVLCYVMFDKTRSCSL